MLSSLKLCSLGGTSVFVLNVITAHLSDLSFHISRLFLLSLIFSCFISLQFTLNKIILEYLFGMDTIT